MKRNGGSTQHSGMDRRDFLTTMGTVAGYIAISAVNPTSSAGKSTAQKGTPTVMGAFIYPPTEELDKVGYYSWPGSTFDAEGHQAQYMQQIGNIGQELEMNIFMKQTPLDEERSVTEFINEVKAKKPDGLLLIPFKKGHWGHVTRIVKETKIPSVVLATLGVLLVGHIRELHEEPGVYMISSLDNFDAVEYGMRMIKTARTMKESRIINIAGESVQETVVPHLGTKILTIPRSRLVEEIKKVSDQQSTPLAKRYLSEAERIVEPSEEDVYDAAKCYFALKRVIEAEGGDALMMDCLPGLRRPHVHVPPCMGFMDLRDEGIPAGCESDTDATLTMMLIQNLFNRPGFQHNPFAETEKNHYLCAHCTAPSKMNGPGTPSEPYILRSHAEAGWGCVPRVLFKVGQEVTITKYLRNNDSPQMLIYTGEILGCPSIPPTGGCRTNAETTLNELDDVCNLKGHHLTLFYGNCGKQLREFCKMYRIEPVV